MYGIQSLLNKVSSSLKYFILGLIFFNLMIASVLTLSLIYNYHQIESREEKEIANLSDIVEFNLNNIFHSIDVTLTIIVSEIENINITQSLSDRLIQQHFSYIDTLMPESLGIRISNKQGELNIKEDDGRDNENVNISDRDYFQYLRDHDGHELYFSKPLLDRYTGKHSIILAKRINNAEGKFVGTAHVSIPIDILTKRLSKFYRGDHSVISLWEDSAHLITRTNSNISYEQSQTIKPNLFLQQAMTHQESVISYQTQDSLDGINRHYTDNKIGHYPLYVSVGRADDDIFYQWRQDVYHIIILFLIFFFVTIISFVFIWLKWGQKNLYRNIERLFENRLETIVAKIKEASVITNNQGKIRYFNCLTEKMFDCSLLESKRLFIGDIIKISHEDDGDTSRDLLKECIDHCGYYSFPITTKFKNRHGHELYLEAFVIPLHTPDEKVLGLLWMFKNVQQQRELTLEITYKATHDSLTGLLNRSAFDEQMSKLLNSMKEDTLHGLLYLDLDRFKIVNDTCGHQAGDQLLKEITQNISTIIRDRDIFVRLGGDEFAIVLTHCKLENIYQIAEKIRKSVDEYRLDYDHHFFHIGVSIGLVVIDKSWTNLSSLLQAADSACYAAKNSGRNRIFNFNQEDRGIYSHQSDVNWVQNIDNALINNSFVLYWQKIQSIKSTDTTDKNKPQRSVKGEVLLRMQSDTGEILLPGPIIKAAEKFFIITEIDKWVVKTLFSWFENNNHILEHLEMLSFNLSGQSIGDIAFHNFIYALVENTKINCHKLCIEITETAAITNSTYAIDFLNKMRLYGFKTSLDDFGSGMSSFGYLKTLPFDYLKIDGQFVKNIENDEIDQATVKSMCDIAHAMGKKTVAEFVETELCEKILISIGADYTQGYYRHRPEPITTLLEDHYND